MKYTVLLLAAALAACSYSSTPLTNTYSIKSEDGIHRYQLTCGGLFGGKGSCERQAEKICGETGQKPVGKFKNDVMLFQCGAPSVETR